MFVKIIKKEDINKAIHYDHFYAYEYFPCFINKTKPKYYYSSIFGDAVYDSTTNKLSDKTFSEITGYGHTLHCKHAYSINLERHPSCEYCDLYLADVKICGKTNYIEDHNLYTGLIKLYNFRRLSSLKIWNNEEFKLKSVKQSGNALRYIRNPSVKIIMQAIKTDGYAINYIDQPTIEYQKAAIKKDAYNIQYIKQPTEEIQLLTVSLSSDYIQYIKNPTEKVQLKAVRHNGLSVRHIKNPSKYVMWEAIKNNCLAVKCINKSGKLQSYFYRKNNMLVTVMGKLGIIVSLLEIRKFTNIFILDKI